MASDPRPSKNTPVNMPSSSSVADDATQTAAKPPTQVLRYVEPILRYRALMSDGRVVDIEATNADSNMRGWLLEQLGSGGPKSDLKIIGITRVEATE